VLRLNKTIYNFNEMTKRKKDESTVDINLRKKVKVVNCTNDFENNSHMVSIKLGNNARINYKALEPVIVEKHSVDLKKFFIGNKFAFEKELVDFSSAIAVQKVLKEKYDLFNPKNNNHVDEKRKLMKNKNLVSLSTTSQNQKSNYATKILSDKIEVVSKNENEDLYTILVKKYNVLSSDESFAQWLRNKSKLQMPMIKNSQEVIEKLWNFFLIFPYPTKVELNRFASQINKSFILVESIFKMFREENKISWSSDEIIKNLDIFKKRNMKANSFDQLDTSENKKVDTTVHNNIEKLEERIKSLENIIHEIHTPKKDENKLIEQNNGKFSDTSKNNESNWRSEPVLDVNLDNFVKITDAPKNINFNKSAFTKKRIADVISGRKNNYNKKSQMIKNNHVFQHNKNLDKSDFCETNKYFNRSFPESCITGGVGTSLRTSEKYNSVSTNSHYNVSEQFPQQNNRHFLDLDSLDWQTVNTSAPPTTYIFQQNQQKTEINGNNTLFIQNLGQESIGATQEESSTNNSKRNSNFLGVVGWPT